MMLTEVGVQGLGVEACAFGHDRERVRLATRIRGPEFTRNLVRRRLDLWNRDYFRPAGDARHERQVGAASSHHFDEKGPLVRGGGRLEAINGFQRDVERGVDA